MKTKAPADRPNGLKSAIPVRFDEDDIALMKTLSERTGLKSADIVRRAFRFAAPKFRDGEANIADAVKPAA